MFTFEHFQGTKRRVGTNPRDQRRSGGKGVSELPLILVIEDEYTLQGVVEDALTEGGFDTDILSSGEEALTLFKARIKDYRALVTDVNLKGHLSGWDVAKQVREINPACPVIYMTGAASDQWASHGVPNSILLQKPFAPAQLVTAVSNLLNAASTSIAPEG
jgi:DNA-binding response OmpR family regulator